MKTEYVKTFGDVLEKEHRRFLCLKINFECYLKFFRITGTFFDSNFVLYIEGKKLLLSEIFSFKWRYIYETNLLLLHRHNEDRLKSRSFIMRNFRKEVMKIDCIKTALANGIGIASNVFGCTHRKHTC